ncbi:MAG: Blue-light-activated protein [bacterium ADurb.Bin243]|nr:MAG: Blue-light-activated protein [bacterium ADurb.Bin243]
MNESIKILFIEDNPGDVFLFREMLVRAKLDFELFVRTSLKDAAESLTGKEKFDLLILDLSLPDSNGINTLVSIKSHSDDIPIIVLTGTNDYDTGASAIAEGAQDYLVKEEVDGTVLMRSIRYARERHRLLVELERASKKELKISEERYRAIVEDQTELICRFDPNGVITFVNGAYCRFFKGVQADFTGKQFKSQAPAASHALIDEKLQSLGTEKQIVTFDYSFINEASSEKQWLEWTCRAIFDENSVIKEFQAAGLDITERKRAEEELQVINDNLETLIRDRTYELAYTNSKLEKEIFQRKSAEESLESEKERLAVMLRSIGEGVIAVDNHMKVTLINSMAELIIGWSSEEAFGRNLDDIFCLYNSINGQKIENPAGVSIANGEIVVFGHQTKILSRSKNEIFASITCAPIRDKNNKIIGAILAFRDMTEHKKIEEELLKISKLESLSLLASGIAHDFNNFLTGIVGNISLAKMLTTPESEINKILTSAEDISFQAKELTVQLLTFARGGTANKKLTDIGELLKNSISFMARGSNVKCEFSISDALAPVEIDISQINQVVSNLVINSIQAMPDGGLITLSAENIRVSGEMVPLKKGDYVKITFKDNGSGIEEKNLAKIFDPYFTTKAKGNGLGLSSVYSIIKSHGGLITVDSKIGEGTSFIIYLPASHNALSQCSAESQAAAPREKKASGKGRILIMDDEELIRNITSQLLNHLGFDTVCAADGAAAIELYKAAGASGAPFDVIITDLTVPGGMGGVEMIKNIIAFDPEVKAVAASGYFSDQSKIEDFEKAGFKEYITKPFKINEVVKTLQKLIKK